MLNIEKLMNGNLKLSLTDEGKIELIDLLLKFHHCDMNWNDIWVELLSNTEYTVLEPEDVGALTSSVIITDHYNVYEDDEGFDDIKELGNIYWFPNYQVENEFETLLDKEYLILTLSEDEETDEE